PREAVPGRDESALHGVAGLQWLDGLRLWVRDEVSVRTNAGGVHCDAFVTAAGYGRIYWLPQRTGYDGSCPEPSPSIADDSHDLVECRAGGQHGYGGGVAVYRRYSACT